MAMRRRDFLKTAGSFVVSAGLGGLGACGDDDDGGGRDGGAADGGGRDGGGRDGGGGDDGGARSFTFPHGVASGDPRPTSVMLWTRVQAQPRGGDPVALTLEVATDEAFSERVVDMELEATAASDHTVRELVEDLSHDTVYYYRFNAGSAQSRVGRTWTAPTADADLKVRFAWVSCQDYTSGFYGAYRRLINTDDEAAAADPLRFVLHLGDFIYETRSAEFQMALDENLEPVMLVDQNGNARAVAPFPSGGGMLPEAGATFAESLADYRHLYKTVLSDPDLQAARARWPFVCMWDDHEFSNDYWQTQANYTREDGSDEPSQRRKMAANQAWFEYVPAILSDADEVDGQAPAARDFEFSEVEDAAYSEVIDVDEPNNATVLASVTIYRRLRFGRHVDLVLTDARSYRSDHALAEEVSVDDLLVFHPRAALPLDVVVAFDAGRTANDGNPLANVGGFMNTRMDSPPGTLLGADQKQWWKDAMASSTATFKVWGNALPLARVRLDATDVPLFPGDLVLSADAWDGYPTERNELMAFLRDENILNVISLSGDYHSHVAGLVLDDHDADAASAVMLDFTAAGISSQPQWSEVAGAIDGAVPPELINLVAPVLKQILYDATEFGGPKAVVNLNTLIRYGSTAGNVAAETHDIAMIEAARNPDVNPHLRYVDTGANGYGIAEFDGEGARIELVTIERPVRDRGEDGAELIGTATFVVPRRNQDEDLELAEPELSGRRPFPLE
jgi:alkaline phosphatase D